MFGKRICFGLLTVFSPWILLAQGGPSVDVKRELSISLTGSVVQEDGNSPALEVIVELVCDGQPQQQSFLSSSGRFSLKVGRNTKNTYLSASAASAGSPSSVAATEVRRMLGGSGNRLPEGWADPQSIEMGMTNLAGCEIHARTPPGYASEPIKLGVRSVFDNPDTGVIILRKIAVDGSSTVHQSLLAAPEKAREAFEKGRDELLKPDADLKKAEKWLKKSVSEYPEFAVAWNLLGRLYLGMNDGEQARQAFEKTLSLDPMFLNAHLELARMAFEKDDWPGTVQHTSRVKELEPGLVENLYMDGTANFYLNQPEITLRTFSILREAGYSQSYPVIHFYLGMIHANRGDLPAAAKELRTYLRLADVVQQVRDAVNHQLDGWVQEGLIEAEEKAEARKVGQ